MKKINSKSKTVLLVGAVVYDALFDLSSAISDQIIITDGKAGNQNLMFSAKTKEIYFGGPAGNVAYGLSLLKGKPILASIAGKDFGDYAARLQKMQVVSRVYADRKMHTAMFYGMTDTSKRQIGVFQGGGYHALLPKFPISKLIKKSDWKHISIGLFSPGTAQSIVRDMREFRAIAPLGAIAILDPGQMLAADFTPGLFSQAVRLADFLILNEFEAHFMKTVLGFTHEKLWKLGLKHLIITHAEKGSLLHASKNVVNVNPVKAKKVVDPTGAGDAFRAGLIHGLLSGKTILQSMEVGSKLGAKCVAFKGAQMYKI